MFKLISRFAVIATAIVGSALGAGSVKAETIKYSEMRATAGGTTNEVVSQAAQDTISQYPAQEIPNLQQSGSSTQTWKQIRSNTETRVRPNDFTFDTKAEFVTQDGLMIGIQQVFSNGTFRGVDKEGNVYSGQWTQRRTEGWIGVHGDFSNSRGRWSANFFVRLNGAGDSGVGGPSATPWTWENFGENLQAGLRGRVEYDVVKDSSQVLTVHGEAEAAVTISGDGGPAHSIKGGATYSTSNTTIFAEGGHNDDGLNANGYARYSVGKPGRVRPFAEIRGEVGSNYQNVTPAIGVSAPLGENLYVEGSVGYNMGSAGNGIAPRASLNFTF